MSPIPILLATALAAIDGPDSTIRIEPDRVLNRISPLMYGSCIEDVNHEIYGGLYAQLLFGESFEEPPSGPPAAGWAAFGGRWKEGGGTLEVVADAGAKVVADGSTLGDGVVACDLRFLDESADSGGLIARVRDPKPGPDDWTGYEVSLSTRHQALFVGRHDHNYAELKRVPFAIRAGEWHHLEARFVGPRIVVSVDGSGPLLTVDDPAPLGPGLVGLRTWNSNLDYRDASSGPDGGVRPITIRPPAGDPSTRSVSGAWDLIVGAGTAVRAAWDADRPFNSGRSQSIERTAGAGAVDLANRGLNRWGIAVRAGQPFRGRLYTRGDEFRGTITVALRDRSNATTYASATIGAPGPGWARRDFALASNATDADAQFVISTKGDGRVWFDQAVLTGDGPDLVEGLPFRADITAGLQAQGLTLLRYGGSMVNAVGYRWKSMIGDPDRRPQYRGTWYPWSTNGFGIEEFVRYCRVAGFEPVVSINIEETPGDAADLVEYLNGPSTSTWGRVRAANGHAEPYGLKYLEIGNEEVTNAHYLERFQLLADAIRPRDADIRLIIGAWWEPDNPISKQIVVETSGKAAFWDLHVGADDPREGPRTDRMIARMRSLLREWAPDAPLRAVVLEENGSRPDLQRALGHATTLNATQRHGDFIPIDCPANTIQAWKQNDNGWDQGQLFYRPGLIWMMPNYYAQKMAAAAHRPLRVAVDARSPGDDLDVLAARSEDASSLVLKVVNVGATPHAATVDLGRFGPAAPTAEVVTLAGNLTDRNTPDAPEAIKPIREEIAVGASSASIQFPPHSFRVITFRRR